MVGDGDANHIIPPSGSVARCAATSTPAGAVEGLPDPSTGILFIVSALVRSAVPARADVASPGDLVRDAAGAVIGCRNLVVN